MADRESENAPKSKASIPSTTYQTQECILYGSVFSEFLPDLERRLAGLCDPGNEEYNEHEMSFSLRTGNPTPDVTIRLRRRFRSDAYHNNQWLLRYIGVPEPDEKCPVIVRKVIDSVCYSHDMMVFAKTLGLRMDYEYITKGSVWTNGKIKIVTSHLQRSERPGHYDSTMIRKLSDSVLVEMSISLPESAEYTQEAKRLRDFADQFVPLMCRGNKKEDNAAEKGPEENEKENRKKKTARIAILGCGHGFMDAAYSLLADLERKRKIKFDLLMCCGDFQSARHHGDRLSMHVNPRKDRGLQDFYQYYSGEKVAPILTVFVGGNHEASAFLAEIPNGGFVAPNIYFLGHAGVVRFAGIRIGGLSGIYQEKQYYRGRYEQPPFQDHQVVSVYNVRWLDVWRLNQLRPADDDKSSNPLDIMLTHDWPAGITNYGDVKELIKMRPDFKRDIDRGRLGNTKTMELLLNIRPRYWFSAHMHVNFVATVPHKTAAGKNPQFDGANAPQPTKFEALASLDKPLLPQKAIHVLELDVEDDADFSLSYDPEWLAILKSTDVFMSTSRKNIYIRPPSPNSNKRRNFRPTTEELAAIRALGNLRISPEAFKKTAPPLLTRNEPANRHPWPILIYRNPQSENFCRWLGIKDLNKMHIDSNPRKVDVRIRTRSGRKKCCGSEQVATENEPPAPVIEGESRRKARIAVAGCAHGELDKIYDVLAEIEKERGFKFDLLICCGDFQSVRNYGDLHHMHVNQKYRNLQTFYKYYSGEKETPVLTMFVGGNHEASGYLAELPNGGWVAPKIYFMGFASVVRFAGLRIGGLSGIYNQREYLRGHYERPPFENFEVTSIYHVRNLDVWRLKQLRSADDDKLSNPLDIMVTHDWPSGITDFGDVKRLLRVKPYFEEDIKLGKLGNPGTMQLLYDIRPRYWLSAHLHVAFPALVPHKFVGADAPQPTRFIALDKPLPRRQFVQVLELDVEEDADFSLSHDPEWLAVLKSTDSFTSMSKNNIYMPSSSSNSDERHDFRPTAEELAAIQALGDLTILPEAFKHTAPPLLTQDEPANRDAPPSLFYRNPQSENFCRWLGIKDLNKMLIDSKSGGVGTPYYIDPTSSNGISQMETALDVGIEDFGDADFIIDRGNGVIERDEILLDDETEVPDPNLEGPEMKKSRLGVDYESLPGNIDAIDE
ncbi:unnamed protein product [Caenorhabditis auriculariae]|uniref:Mediator of RNA polymerase II transcription subunit 18 n=1 Tax=Caenorhabditis auriculariae TaxID=2777116 RepID=A0A8S1HFQ8_9PELO|nr:unnamed protein product [Caenorhabditis auriculariae]